MEAKRYVTVSDFAAHMGVTDATVRVWIRQGQIHASQKWLISEAEVKRVTEDAESIAAGRIIEGDLKVIEVVRLPAFKPVYPKDEESRINTDCLLFEIRRKCAVLESENRRMMDQNLRFRSMLHDELLLWEAVVKQGKQLSYGEAKRHISALIGAANYEGRDEGPLDYRERSIGGNLRADFDRRYPNHRIEQQEEASESRPQLEDLREVEIDDAPKPGIKPDPWKVRAIIAKNRSEHKQEIGREGVNEETT